MEQETEAEPTGSLEAGFSGTQLHKPCNLFIMVSTGVGSLTCAHVAVVVAPRFTSPLFCVENIVLSLI